MADVRVKAHVTMTVEINVTDSWGGDCPMAQVYQQATESAKARMCKGMPPGPFADFIIIGEPKVTAILVERTGR